MKFYSLSGIIAITGCMIYVACSSIDAGINEQDGTLAKSEYSALAKRIKEDPTLVVGMTDLQRMGLFFNEKTDLETGRVLLEKLVREHPENTMGKLLLANNYRESTMYNEALALYDDVARIDSIRFLALAERARLYILIHDFKNASSDIEDSKRIQPNFFGALLAEGLLRYAEGDVDQALELLSTAETLDPGMSSEASLFAGYILLKSGVNTEAATRFSRAIQVAKFINLGYAYINRGVCQINLQDTVSACRDWDSAYKYMPQEAISYITNYCKGIQR